MLALGVQAVPGYPDRIVAFGNSESVSLTHIGDVNAPAVSCMVS